MLPQILVAFGFGNLAMLGWLAVAAAPLLIHLWSRHRFREAPRAAMQFLLAAMRKNARRLQLQQWLLLAVRTLIIALVVFAVAEPYGERLLAGLSGAPIHKILVIDGSYSMDYRSGDTRFARAKQAAAAIVRESRSGDTFTVIAMSAPSKIVLGRELVDHAAIIEQIEDLSQSRTSADLAGALALVEESINDDARNRRMPDRHEVCLISDLQRTTWQFNGEATPGVAEQIRQQIASIAKQATFEVIDLGQPQSINLAITSLSTSEPIVAVGREITFDVELRQFGQEPRNQCAVELRVDGVPASEQTIDVPAGADVALHFTHRFNSPGEHRVEVRAAADNLEVDNTRWLVVPVRDEVRVLCIAGRPDAAKYVADALNPNPAGDSPIRPIVVSEGDLADIELAGFDAVFVCNVAQFTTSEAQRLSRFAASGGGIVFFLGNSVESKSYNGLVAGSDPLLPATLGEVVDQPQFGLDPLDYRHPIVSPFRGRERSGLLTTPVAKYFRLEPAKNRSGVEVAAAMPGGDPFIVTAPLGRGRIVLIATDGSLSSVDAKPGEPWTNWPTWPSFLPLIREVLAYAMSGRQQEWQQLVGTSLNGRRDAEGPAKPPPSVNPGQLKIERPDGQSAPVSVQSLPTGAEWSYADTDLNGVYILRGLPNNEPRYFAVNVNTKESDLAQTEIETLPPELRSIEDLQDSSASNSSPVISHARWNEWLLWGVLVLLFVESFLAWHFGRGAL